MSHLKQTAKVAFLEYLFTEGHRVKPLDKISTNAFLEVIIKYLGYVLMFSFLKKFSMSGNIDKFRQKCVHYCLSFEFGAKMEKPIFS